MQQIYEFKSLEGVSVSFVTHTILKLIGREASMGISPFNKDSYELLIGENVFNILPDVFKNVRKFYGIDIVRLSYGCKTNCIILDKKDDGKFKDLSPRIFDTIYDDIIKAVLMNHITVSVGDKRSKGDFKMMNFGQAIEALKNGKKVARVGWNGKGMFLYMTTGSVVHLDEMKSETANYLRSFCKDKCMDEIEICPHIDMKTADNKLVIGWLASQTDILAEDWYVVIF